MKDGSKMTIIQGKLQMKDGSSVEKYLADWQKQKGHEDGTPIRLMTQKQYRRTLDLYSMFGIG